MVYFVRNRLISVGKSNTSVVCHAVIAQLFILSALRSATDRSDEIHPESMAICIEEILGIIFNTKSIEGIFKKAIFKKVTKCNEFVIIDVYIARIYN